MKCLYIYNPKSGKGRAEKKRAYIERKLSTIFDSLDIVKTEYANHARELASNACGKYDTLIVAGGDGTLNEVVNGLMEKENRPVLGYIPLGTVNDFAHSVGIPCSIKGAVKNICQGAPMSHEVFKAGNRYGIYVCALGVATETSYATKQEAKKVIGKFAYFFHGIKRIFTAKSIPVDLEFEGGQIKSHIALFMAVNSRYVASFRLNKRLAYNDGVVDVLLIKENKKRVSLASLLTIARMFVVGFGKKMLKRVTHLQLDKFTLTVPDSVVINLDGEGVGSGKFEFEVCKDALQIIVPKK